MQILLYFLLVLHVLVCLLIVLVVLMQRPRSEGLGAAFGSGMTDNIFGAQTTNVLAKFTTYLGGAFFLLTLGLAMVYSHIYNDTHDSRINQELLKMPAAKAPVTATPAPVGQALPAQSAATVAPTPAAPAALAPASAQTPAVTSTPATTQPVSPLAPATPAPAAP